MIGSFSIESIDIRAFIAIVAGASLLLVLIIILIFRLLGRKKQKKTNILQQEKNTDAIKQRGETPYFPNTVPMDQGGETPYFPNTVPMDQGGETPYFLNTVPMDQGGQAPYYPHTMPMDQAGETPYYPHTVPMDQGVIPNVENGWRPMLRFVGAGNWPAFIPVDLSNQGRFTIGRQDVQYGRAQSDFEFPPESQTISRHHACIYRDNEGYVIEDVGSKGGTRINGTQIETKTGYRLRPGYRVMFGYLGAEYEWME